MQVDVYSKLLRRRWPWLVAALMVAALLGLIYSKATRPVYQGSTKLLITQAQLPGQSSYQDPTTTQRTTNTYTALLLSQPILQQTIQDLGLPFTVKQLQKNITVTNVANSDILQITVEDTDPNRAAAIANDLALVFIKNNQGLQLQVSQDANQQVTSQLEQLRQNIDDTSRRLGQLRATPDTAPTGEQARLQGDLTQYQQLYFQLLNTQQQLAIAQAQATGTIRVAEPASAASVPIRPRTSQNMLIAGLLGLFAMTAIVLLLEYFDDRVRDPENLQRHFDLPLLAAIRRSRRIDVTGIAEGASRHDHFAEALRLLRTNLEFMMSGDAKVVSITSAEPGEGKSTIACSLAITEAQAGKRVILIDGDLRQPSLHQQLGLGNQYGLSTYLSQHAQSLQLPPLQRGPLGMSILTSGPVPPNPAEILGSARMRDLIALLREHADVVIVDNAPILPVVDTVVLQRYVDGVVLVVNARRTKVRNLDQAVQRLGQVSATLYGVVLNNVKEEKGALSYGYHQRAARSRGLRGLVRQGAISTPPAPIEVSPHLQASDD